MIGYCYYKSNDLANAEKHLKLALEHNKLDKISNFTMGEIAFERGDYKQATDYFKIVAQDPAYKEKVRKYYAQIEEKLFSSIK